MKIIISECTARIHCNCRGTLFLDNDKYEEFRKLSDDKKKVWIKKESTFKIECCETEDFNIDRIIE